MPRAVIQGKGGALAATLKGAVFKAFASLDVILCQLLQRAADFAQG